MVALHTLTRGRHTPWLAEAVRSVPRSVQHVVMHCEGNFREMRWKGLQLGEMVGAVDDDDRLRAGAVEACVAALEATGAGIAFTYEAEIDAEGNAMPVRHRRLTLRDVAMHPKSLHHFALIRRGCLPDEVLHLSERFHQGSIDWLTKAWVAVKHGAVQVPMVGYERRLHAGGLSQEPAELAGVREHMDSIRRLIVSWMKHDAQVPQFTARQEAYE